ncbi:hypothetical protein ACN28E_06065 [Archangium lansingense]|uniref:hypothetical protein n=1 Tax=Archangium lansingense TaxID=2995310 RepID=UPI003B80C3D7
MSFIFTTIRPFSSDSSIFPVLISSLRLLARLSYSEDLFFERLLGRSELLGAPGQLLVELRQLVHALAQRAALRVTLGERGLQLRVLLLRLIGSGLRLGELLLHGLHLRLLLVVLLLEVLRLERLRLERLLRDTADQRNQQEDTPAHAHSRLLGLKRPYTSAPTRGRQRVFPTCESNVGKLDGDTRKLSSGKSSVRWQCGQQARVHG